VLLVGGEGDGVDALGLVEGGQQDIKQLVSDAFVGDSCTKGIIVTTAADIDVDLLRD